MNQNHAGSRRAKARMSGEGSRRVAARAEPLAAAQMMRTAAGKARAAHFDPGADGSTMFAEQAWGRISRSLKLSGRELQIVRAVFDDRIESAIAAELGISAHTVHTHFNRLHRKLGVADRPQLILRIVNTFLKLPASPARALHDAANRPVPRL